VQHHNNGIVVSSVPRVNRTAVRLHVMRELTRTVAIGAKGLMSTRLEALTTVRDNSSPGNHRALEVLFVGRVSCPIPRVTNGLPCFGEETLLIGQGATGL
jgi:hypothetical protein